ncbi:MAG: exopolyphosphatase [Helicobacteraceae bacterium]|jgi:nanoRNase/pAp phosphatase (c-di-AMP/oligoRNAs hydrolase)|nr:exopolyphosphatase [Helicobacteraceae bacterium]
MTKKYRLITRSDFDGLVCAILLRELDIIDEIKFVHPKDMQDGLIEITSSDITTNLPYVEGVYLAFDHHESEALRNKVRAKNHINDPGALSAAHVVYEYYGGRTKFTGISEEMMRAIDKADSGHFSLEEILRPQGWVLLNYLMDARTGLGRFKEFRISNYQLMMDLIAYCRTETIDKILELPDVKERSALYFAHEEQFKEQIGRCSKVYGKLVVLDLRNEETIYAGNRFMIYALYPQCNISIHVLWGFQRKNIALATGKSIINRTSKINIGELMLDFGGGGHNMAGTCQVPVDAADETLAKLIKQISKEADFV